MSKEVICIVMGNKFKDTGHTLDRTNKNQRSNTLLVDWISSSGESIIGETYQVITATSDRFKAVQKITGEPVSE